MRRLGGEPTVSLHGDAPRSGATGPASGAPFYTRLSRRSAQALREAAAAQRVSLLVLFQLALLMAWSERLDHQSDRFCFNSIATISRTRSDLLDLIGPMGEPLPICVCLPARTSIREALACLHEANLDAVENALPITTLTDHVGLPRRSRVSFNYLNTPRPSRSDGPIHWTLEFERPYARVPQLPGDGELVIYIHDAPDGAVDTCMLYNERNLDLDTVRALAARMLDALHQLATRALDAPWLLPRPTRGRAT